MSKPQIDRVESDVFDPAGGDRMTIFGSNFSGYTDVRVGTSSVTVTGEPMTGVPEFDGTNDVLTLQTLKISDLLGATDFWFGVLFKSSTGTVATGTSSIYYPMAFGDNAGNLCLSTKPGAVKVTLYDTTVGYDAGTITVNADNNWHFAQVWHDGTSLHMSLDGTEGTPVAIPLTWWATYRTGMLAKIGPNYTGLEWMSGIVAEVLTSSSQLSSGDRANVASYINKRYGLSLGGILPSTFDPASLSLSGWWRSGGYSNGTWTGTASAGSSSGRSLVEATNKPASASSSILVCTAPAKSAGQYPVAVRNADGWTSLASAVQYANPGTIANCVWWLRPDDADVDVDGSTEVTAWRDKSGSGDSNRNVTPPTADNPAWNASDADYGGKPTVGTFRRSGSFYLTCPAWSASYGTFTIGVVGECASGAYYTGEGLGNEMLGYNSGTIAYSQAAAKSIQSAGDAAHTKRTMMAAVYNGASSVLHRDAASKAGDLGTHTLGDATHYVGSFGVGDTATYGVTKLAELVAWSGAKTLREMRTFRRYRDSYYGAPA